MCIACALPKGTKMSENEFVACWNRNSDGGGYTFLDENGKFVTKKSMDLEEFKNFWIEDHKKRGEHSPFLLHFRIGTHGTKDITNVHPFPVNSDLVMAHNGVISNIADNKDGRSDTRTFCEDYLSGMPKNFLNNPATKRMVEYALGTNKVVFLDRRGNFTIIGSKAGSVSEGRWFSNSSYIEERKPVIYSGYMSQQGQVWDVRSGKYEAYRPNSQKYSSNSVRRQCIWCLAYVIQSKWNYMTDACDECHHSIKKFSDKYNLTDIETQSVFRMVFKLHPSGLKHERPEIISTKSVTLFHGNSGRDWKGIQMTREDNTRDKLDELQAAAWEGMYLG